MRGKCVWAGVAPSLGRTEALVLLGAFLGAEMGGGWPEPHVGPSQHCVSPSLSACLCGLWGELREALPQSVSAAGSDTDYVTPSDAG